MKELAEKDYYIQIFFIIAGIIVSVVGFQTWGSMAFYFVVGVPQLISFLIKLFIKIKKSVIYIIYGVTIVPVWISMLIVTLSEPNNDIVNFFGCILIGALIYSPILSILYVYECHNLYKSLKKTYENPHQPHPHL